MSKRTPKQQHLKRVAGIYVYLLLSLEKKRKTSSEIGERLPEYHRDNVLRGLRLLLNEDFVDMQQQICMPREYGLTPKGRRLLRTLKNLSK